MKTEIKGIIDNRLNELRELRKRTASNEEISKIERGKRDFLFYYTIQEIESLKIKILNKMDEKTIGDNKEGGKNDRA